MQLIQATINPDDKGSEVFNLQQALQFLYERGVFKSLIHRTLLPPKS